MRVKVPNSWSPRDYQWDAWDYLYQGGKHAELVWHRRSGKDELCLHFAAVSAIKRVAGYWHMLPEYAQARKAIWSAVNPHTGKRRIDEAFPLELRRKTREHEMMIEFVNGSTWQVVGSDNYNSLVGSGQAGIVYSEWALANANARAYLRPIILENNGWQIFVTTPRGQNHAYDTLQAAKKNPKAFAQVLPWHKTGIIDAAKAAEELEAYQSDFGVEHGQAKFEQEYECSFDAANLGAILAGSIHRASLSGRIDDKFVYDPRGSKIEISADIGRRDTSTWWFWQPRIGGFVICDYMGGAGYDADEWCDKIYARLKESKMRLGTIWLPHDARAKTFAAKHSAVEIFVKRFGAKRIEIVPSVKRHDRINAARTLIKRIAFHETNCQAGINGLRNWAYEYNEQTKAFSNDPKHDWASHDGDGFSYGCVVMTQTKRPEPKEKNRSIQEATLNEIWKLTQPRGRTRI